MCSKGYYAANTSATTCDPCPAGYASTTEGARACVECEPGKVAEESPSDECTACPGDQGKTSLAGSTVCDQCLEGW